MSVYISEAHANDEWPIRTKKELCINQHKNNKDKIKCALFMKNYIKWEIPLYVDFVNNKDNEDNKDKKDKKDGKDKKEKEMLTFENVFAAWPFRVVFIDKDLKISWILHPKTDKNGDGIIDFDQIKDKLSQMVDE